MPLLRSLATAVLATFFIAATAHGQPDSAGTPAFEAHLQKLGQLAREANELKEASRLKEFRTKYAEAKAVHQQAADELAQQQKALDAARGRLDAALNEIVLPQIMVQAVLVESQDLDDAVLHAACTRVHAEAVDGDVARNIEPSVYSMSSEQSGKLLAAIEKQRRTQVIARPSILAIDGQVAEITMGQPVKTMTATRNDQGKTKFEPGIEHAGLTVALTPTIQGHEQTQITLAVKKCQPTGSMVVIGADQQGKSITTPIINSQKMETTVTATDGRTILVAVQPIKVFEKGRKPEPTKTTLILLTPRVVERTADIGEILHH